MSKLSRLVVGLFGVTMSLAAVAAEEGTTESEKVAIPPVVVQDTEGKPVAGAEVAVMHKERGYMSSWKKAGADGRVTFDADEKKGSTPPFSEGDYEVLVFARGKAPTTAEMTIPSDKPVTVTPKDGKEVELTITTADGNPAPQGITPRVYPQAFSFPAWSWEPDDAIESAWPEPLGDGRFRIELAEDTTAPYRVLIHDPKLVRGFQAPMETTAALASGKAEVKLPATGTLSAGLSIPEKYKESAAKKTFSVAAMTIVDSGKENRIYYEIAKTKIKGDDDKTTVTWDNVAPGNFWIQVMEDTDDGKDMMERFRKGESAAVKAGQTETVAIAYKEVDLDDYKGDGVAEITVLKQDGSPAAGMAVKLTTYDRDISQEVTITSGTLSDKGTTTIAGLKTPGYYNLDSSEKRETIGRVSFRKEGDNKKTFTLTVPPFEGDMAPDITLVDINTSQSRKLSDYRGKVVLLDFWATWCGPCQGPMEHNQQLTVKNAEKWKDKAVIVGASIDDSIKTVLDHVKKKGWTAVDQLWCNEEPGSEDPKDPSNVYGITGVPTAFLIDANGRIVKRGHPAAFEIEKEIDELLSGKKAGGN